MCEYIEKVDENYYVFIEIGGKGKLVTKAVFLHNTKVASSNIGENKEPVKDDGKVIELCISQMEMILVMLKCPEVYTNLWFIPFPTMSL